MKSVSKLKMIIIKVIIKDFTLLSAELIKVNSRSVKIHNA